MKKIKAMIARVSVLQLVTAIATCNLLAVIAVIGIGRLVLNHNLILILAFFVPVQLPVVYEIVTQSLKKPSSLFGAYLGVVGHMVFLPMLLVSLIFALFESGLLFFLLLLGAPIVMLGIFISGWGMPGLVFIQPLFWLLLMFKMGKRIHPDLKNPVAALVFTLAVATYAVALVLFYFFLSTLLIPASSPLWDSWMFN